MSEELICSGIILKASSPFILPEVSGYHTVDRMWRNVFPFPFRVLKRSSWVRQKVFWQKHYFPSCRDDPLALTFLTYFHSVLYPTEAQSELISQFDRALCVLQIIPSTPDCNYLGVSFCVGYAITKMVSMSSTMCSRKSYKCRN